MTTTCTTLQASDLLALDALGHGTRVHTDEPEGWVIHLQESSQAIDGEWHAGNSIFMRCNPETLRALAGHLTNLADTLITDDPNEAS